MASPVTTVADYFVLLGRSKLLDPAEVKSLRENWTGGDGDLDGFRKYLTASRHLTEYQAVMLQRGHADGFLIGGYVILDRIGRGQTAGVYRAVHQSGQVVALKVLPGSKARNGQVLNRFRREGRLLTQLDHANVVRAFQLGQSGELSFIAMEHLEGETLDEVLARRKRIPWAEAARIASQTLNGLQHLHGKRMVHRDLKPANLMLTPPRPPGQADTTLQATVKILDIGLGREWFDDTDPSTQDGPLTQEGAILGTPDYLAPEQARDSRSADIRADVYAVGCVLFHILAGRPPFVERNVMALMVRHATVPPDPVTAHAPDVPPGLAAVIDTMLAKDPANRYQSPSEAARALEPFLPANAAPADESRILPSYKAFLATESDMEVPPGEKPRSILLTPKPAKPVTPPAPPAAPIPTPTAPKPVINVQLVPDPVVPEVSVLPAASPPPTTPTPAQNPVAPPLFPPTRRDWLYFAGGCGVTLAAVGLGYGLAQLARKKPKPVE